jgi:predicted TIM-barrel fold metal-dependent hydrolase
VAELPIIDLHFHPDPGWGASLPDLFDRLGVRAAGNGPSGSSSVAIAEAARHPGRIIPFGGGNEVRQLVLRHGASAWNATHPDVERFLAEIEDHLREGRLKGIGEIHVNNWSSNLPGAPQYRYPADAPLLQRLFALSAAYRVPLSVHMDAEAPSVAQMERLLAANRDGVWLWAHTGHYADPALLRRLLEEHPNLYCELSYRVSISGSRTATYMDDRGRLRQEWRDILESFPDRFVIGTDLTWPSPGLYADHIAFWRRILEQVSPETAAMIAYRNAERLLGPASEDQR